MTLAKAVSAGPWAQEAHLEGRVGVMKIKSNLKKKLPIEGRKQDDGWECCGVKEGFIVFSFNFF